MTATVQTGVRRPFVRFLSKFGLAAGLVHFLLAAAPAPEPAAPAAAPSIRAEQVYRETRTRYLASAEPDEPAWRFARVCFDRAEFAADDKQRADLAKEGIAAARRCIARDPKSAPGHYYLGMNLGQLARTQLLGALKIVPEMERLFKTARQLDEKFDFAGPDRNLGLLYLEAPVWASIGDKKKARQHLRRALQLAPESPENRLNFAEALLKWNEPAAASDEVRALQKIWDEAKQRFAGDEWAASWTDWQKRLDKLRAGLAPQ